MCAPGLKVSIDKRDREAIEFKNKRGQTQLGETDATLLDTGLLKPETTAAPAKKPNPLAVPLKVPGIG